MTKRVSRDTVQMVLDLMGQHLSRWRVEKPTTFGQYDRGYGDGWLEGYAQAMGVMQNSLDKMED